MDTDPELTWKVIKRLFKDDEQMMVRHHIDSYNDFYGKGIFKIFNERNPIILQKEQNPDTQEFNLRCELYLGGKNGDKVYFGKPIIYDDDREHYMFPNEARLRNMTYGTTIHYDVDVVFKIAEPAASGVGTEIKITTATLERILLGRFPIMVQSNLCILHGLESKARFYMGECKNDYGGYFIIDGKEKTIISQEKFADNMLYIRENNEDNIYTHAADIRTVSEDASKPERTLSVRIVAPTTLLTNKQIVVNIPNVRAPVPLFIVMRALGVISDREILEFCLLDLDENADMLDHFIPSIHDANKVFTQEGAIKFIATLTKSKTIPQVHDILMNYFLPQVGETNYIRKAYFLGNMVYKLLRVSLKIDQPTDRDSFKFKRIELSGTLIFDLFKEYYALQQQHIRLAMDREYFKDPKKYEKNFIGLIQMNYQEFFRERIVEDGFKKAFKGNWGASEHTKRIGVIQDLNRLSYNSFLSHLRKINLPMDSSAKIVKPRMLHGSQWGMIDPVDSPDGANIGFHKHLAFGTRVTNHCSAYPMMKWLREVVKMHLLEECTRMFLFYTTKVFVNGTWVGAITRPEETIRLIRLHRRTALIPIYISCRWDIKNNEIHIYTDAGRLCRPIFYIDEETGRPSYDKEEILEMIQEGNASWEQMTTGFTAKSIDNFNPSHCNYYTIDELYGRANDTSALSVKQKVAENIARANTIEDFKRLRSTMAIIEYIDTSETESTLISMSHKLNIPDIDEDNDVEAGSSGTSKKSSLKTQKRAATTGKQYTHVEIHPSLLMGVMGNQICFPENNPVARNVFGCGQAKQAASLYHSNYQVRIDKMGVVINNGEVPIVKSRYLDLINHEEHPCGFNAIVAIMSFNGYNVEDSILFNEASVKRGMFRITYYNMYEAREESSAVRGAQKDTRFVNIQKEGAIGIKPGYDYSHLDDNGLIRENTEMDDKKVVIGVGSISIQNEGGQMRDISVMPKKGQLGFVDKAFMTEGDTGFRLAKVRIREERFPSIGDKFCSRCGQKGTCGLIIPEKDMPFTKDGIRPDIIINPHAIPTRMTIGQLIESLMGKACVMHGGFGNCTAYTNNGTKHESFGSVLTNYGFHSSGTEVLYNGMTGEQLKSDIYIGPTYYMRLKQMVKDKINYRSQGPRTQLTRQTVQGRANDGGLRVGEMERDGILGHGAAHFLNESLMVRGDEYHMAVCNKSGMIAIYNPNQNLFMSPMVDGPIQYSGNLNESGGGSVIQMSKFGRSFSIVRIPYCLKLLIQELLVMNVQMRIITDENIDQLPSMSYSNNIYKVLKDNHGVMGVDDIIEKNRLAAGLKPSMRKNTSGMAGDEAGEDEEAGSGSRVYLSSRGEEDEFNEFNSGKLLRPDIFSDVDPVYLSTIDKLTFNLDIDTKERIHNFGWRFAVKPDIIKQLKTAKAKGISSNETATGEFQVTSLDDLNEEDLVLESIILDKNGEPTERWKINGAQWVGDYPTRFVNSNEITRVTGEIERAKREGNVAEEEKLKVQLTRLTDERTKLNSVRRELEAEIEKENEEIRQSNEAAISMGALSSPKYTGMDESPTDSHEDKLRNAVESFNAKMLDEYAKSPDNFPTSSPSGEEASDEGGYVPSSPKYSSMWEGGGSSSSRVNLRTNKYIPQIPLSILESHIRAKYGNNSSGGTNMIGMIGGASNHLHNGANGTQFNSQHQSQIPIMSAAAPMMNVPLIATMPMTTMIQQNPAANMVGTSNPVGVNNISVSHGTTNANQSGGGSDIIPNAEGVKTLSIKI